MDPNRAANIAYDIGKHAAAEAITKAIDVCGTGPLGTKDAATAMAFASMRILITALIKMADMNPRRPRDRMPMHQIVDHLVEVLSQGNDEKIMQFLKEKGDRHGS